MPVISALFAPALKYITGGLLFVCIVLGIGLHLERVHSRKLSDRVTGLTAELKRISTAKNEQQVVTRDRIRTVTKTIHDAEGRARVVESAPLEPGCKTPKEVLQADI